MWRSDADIKLRSYSIGHIDVEVCGEEDKGSRQFTGFYGNSNTEKRKESWILPERISQNYSGP